MVLEDVMDLPPACEGPLVLPDYSKRRYNQPWKHVEGAD
jgi:hypothetical protein